MAKIKIKNLFVALLFSTLLLSACENNTSGGTSSGGGTSGVDRYYTATWKNYDGSVLYVDSSVKEGTKPVYKGSTPTRPSTSQYDYSFSGWTPDISKAYSNTTYTAVYTSNIKDYTVTWKNYDGTILEIDEKVKYGTYPSYDGTTPTRPSTGEFRYIFSGWSPSLQDVTTNVTYTAQFETTTGFAVTWKNYNGDILELDTDVASGTMPSYDGLTPTRPSDESYNYTFSCWSPSLSPVYNDAVYTATYTSKAKPIEISSISFEKNDIYLFVGETVSISYTVNPSKYYNALSLKSYDPSIATIDGNVIYGATSGTTKIIGYGPDGTKATCNIYVIEEMKLTLGGADALYGYICATTNSYFYLKNNKEENLSGRIYYYENYTETTKKAYSLKFYSKDTSYYDVDEITGKVTCKNKSGLVELKMILSSPISSRELTCKIRIYEGVKVTKYSFSQTQFNLNVGASSYISRTATPSNANIGALTFSSTNEKIASVNNSGYITANNVGSCKIVAYCKTINQYYYFSVIVSGTYATSISTSTSLSVSPSETKKISVSYSPSSANTGKKITYFSDNEEIAIVDNEGNVTGVKEGTCQITLTLENEYKTTLNVVVSEGIAPTSISLSSSSISLKPNTKATLTANITPSNANMFTSKTWTSSNSSVATVSNGVVKALSPGNTNICVSLQNGLKAYCVVTVLDYTRPDSITLSDYSISLDPLLSKTITATINPTDTDKDNKLTWSSSNESIATVKNGVVTGVAPGTCKIKVQTENGVFASCDVTVNPYTNPESVSLNPSSVSVDPNRSTAVVATIMPENANHNLDITWSSSNNSIATVNNGVITGVTPGTCKIYATLKNNITAECSVTVNDYIYAETISLSSTSIVITKDSTSLVVATYLPATANTGTSISYSSSNSSVATVDSSGLVTGKSVGTCTITAKLENGYTKTCSVTVNDYIYAETITLNKTSATLNPSQTLTLMYTINPANAQKGLNVSWSSSNNSVATVSSSGLVEAIDKGSCTITARLENGYTATCTITVNGVAPIIYDANTKENYSNSLYINCTKGESLELESNTKVTYSSSNSSIAYVSNSKLYASGVGTCTLTATNTSGDSSTIKINVYDCSISYNKSTNIINYEYSKNTNNGRYEVGRTVSELKVDISGYKFINGKTLELDMKINKLSGDFEASNVTIQIYDNNGNLICTEVVSSPEKMLFGETISITKQIDLSNYFGDLYSYNFDVKVTDSPFYA